MLRKVFFLYLFSLMIVLLLLLHQHLQALLDSVLQILLYHQDSQNILTYQEDVDRN